MIDSLGMESIIHTYCNHHESIEQRTTVLAGRWRGNAFIVTQSICPSFTSQLYRWLVIMTTTCHTTYHTYFILEKQQQLYDKQKQLHKHHKVLRMDDTTQLYRRLVIMTTAWHTTIHTYIHTYTFYIRETTNYDTWRQVLKIRMDDDGIMRCIILVSY